MGWVGEGWKYATGLNDFVSDFVLKCKGFWSKSIKMKGNNETVEKWVVLNGCSFCSSVSNLVYIHVPIDYLSSASQKYSLTLKRSVLQQTLWLHLRSQLLFSSAVVSGSSSQIVACRRTDHEPYSVCSWSQICSSAAETGCCFGCLEIRENLVICENFLLITILLWGARNSASLLYSCK